MANSIRTNATEDWSDDLNLELNSGHSFMRILPNLLRIVGAGTLLTALYIFLFEGWQNGNDVLRYYMLLGHTALLTIVGLMSGHWLQESKGARLLLILALVSVPANFSILGAFVFSQSPFVHGMYYPQVATWAVNSFSTAMTTTAVSIVFLIPIIWLGFKVLARGMSRNLSFLFIVSNAALLIPIRSVEWVTFLLVFLAFMNLYFSHKIASNQIAAKTSEGLIALGLQFLPLAVIMGRSLWLYSSDLILISALSLTAFFLLRQSSLYLKNSKFFTGLINLLSVISVLAMLFTTSIALFDSRLIAESIVIPVAVFISVLMMIDLGRRNQNTNLYYILAAVIILISLIANQVLFENFVASFMSSLFGAGILIASYKLKQRKLMIQGVILIGVGLGHQLLTLVQQFDLTSWSAMALFGMLAIVIASTIESKSSKIKSRLESLKSAYKDWQ